MIGDSYIVFEDHSIINFTKNSAEKGGAIYVENNGLSKSACFYQISDYMHPTSSKVYFSENQASKAGTVLFGGKIHCILFNIQGKSSKEIFEEIFDYSAISEHIQNHRECNFNRPLALFLLPLAV